MIRYMYEFAEGNKDLQDLLGGKGADLRVHHRERQAVDAADPGR
jgi:hypothetical protein